jgi:hypothetical protein
MIEVGILALRREAKGQGEDDEQEKGDLIASFDVHCFADSQRAVALPMEREEALDLYIIVSMILLRSTPGFCLIRLEINQEFLQAGRMNAAVWQNSTIWFWGSCLILL